MIIYRSTEGLLAQNREGWRLIPGFQWDTLFISSLSPSEWIDKLKETPVLDTTPDPALLAPIQSQEVWAAGVTYQRSRSARNEETAGKGDETFYDKVYAAHRPELFFKATAHRVAGPEAPIRLRPDSKWQVPEPELTLVFTSRGTLLGYTIGNDLSSRDIEGENPLYLPQAKVWTGSCALGPGIKLSEEFPPPETTIDLEILREGVAVVTDRTTLSEMKQTFKNLAEHLFRADEFPGGCFLMTGTGIVPPSDFSLQPGDIVQITIPPLGTLINPVQKVD